MWQITAWISRESCDKVQFIGFGIFEVRNHAERKDRNPQTGKAINIPALKY
ncbi:HU family DNA-binding protein [Lactobacillus crispatus]|uniref:HU family DNA-binding protein n=1 Tax=Lactobacillus crispatus TaxID=47770 RepID=UPI003C12FA96